MEHINEEYLAEALEIMSVTWLTLEEKLQIIIYKNLFRDFEKDM